MNLYEKKKRKYSLGIKLYPKLDNLKNVPQKIIVRVYISRNNVCFKSKNTYDMSNVYLKIYC